MVMKKHERKFVKFAMGKEKNDDEQEPETLPRVRVPRTSTVFVVPPVQNESAEQAELVDDNLYHANQPAPPSQCVIGLSGEITEEKTGEIIAAFLTAKEYSKAPWTTEELASFDKKTRMRLPSWKLSPIRFVLSTYGGSVTEMFAIHDTINALKKDGYIIETHGVGKVMSAGVPLLASGTVGFRSVGPYCRLMMHSVSSFNGGKIDDLENEFKEAKYAQEAYIKCLASLTTMGREHIKDILSKKVDAYMTAKDALNMGIVDFIY